MPPHPLVKHWLAVARNKLSPPPIFRAALAELGRILIYEAARDWLPTLDAEVESPVGLADATYVNPMKPVKVDFCCRVLGEHVCPAWFASSGTCSLCLLDLWVHPLSGASHSHTGRLVQCQDGCEGEHQMNPSSLARPADGVLCAEYLAHALWHIWPRIQCLKRTPQSRFLSECHHVAKHSQLRRRL